MRVEAVGVGIELRQQLAFLVRHARHHQQALVGLHEPREELAADAEDAAVPSFAILEGLRKRKDESAGFFPGQTSAFSISWIVLPSP